MRYESLIAGMCAGLFAATGAASADVSVFAPSLDNTLYESLGGSLSNGSGPNFFSGVTNTPSIRRGLVQFDLSSIPAGSTINSVTLQLTCSNSASGPSPVGLHRVLNSWGEGASNAGDFGGGRGVPAQPGDATWLHRFFDTILWDTPGGDFTPAESATQSVAGPGLYFWGSTDEMVADVQGWVNGSSANFGWLVQGDESVAGDAKRFESRESTISGAAPKLTIDYTPVPAPAGAGVLAIAGLLAARRRR